MDELLNIGGQHGLLVVFLVTLAARIGAPVPAAPLLVVAGGFAMIEEISLVAVFLIAILANLIGDAVWFYAGRGYGARVMKLLCRISLSPDSCVRQSESLISRWGGSSLIAAKFVPGVSVVAAPMAGALGMTTPRFVFFGLIAGALWSAAYLGLGVVFSEQIQDVLVAMSQAGSVAAIGLAALAIAFVLWRYLRRRLFLRSIAMSRISIDDLHALIEVGEPPLIIDVRSEAGYHIDRRQIPGALAIGLNELSARIQELPRDRDIVLYCNCPNDASAASAALVLTKHGFKRVRPLLGGLDAWVAAGRPTATIEVVPA
ncbi:MAG TPA: rhodanese-like domain-containing protein [Burkholderiales bacterium]|nr:rhodanese-like domain-containing protein [Burkholderiales bacterium]